MIAECNSYWQNITCTGRIWLILAEYDLYWQNLTSIGRISLLPAEYDFHWQNMIYTGWLSLLLVEYDLYWQNMTYIGRIWLPLAQYDLYWLAVTLTGRICSQSKVSCSSALLCRFNIPDLFSVCQCCQDYKKLPDKSSTALSINFSWDVLWLHILSVLA